MQRDKTISVRAIIKIDGRVKPKDAPIIRKNNVYVLTNDIKTSGHGIVVEKDSIIIGGNNHEVMRSDYGFGIYLNRRKKVEIKMLRIQNFNYGICLFGSWNSIVENNIESNACGIWLKDSSNNVITKNVVKNNKEGISL